MNEAIVLQFCDTPGLSSALIEWFGHGWCSHVDSVLEDGRLLGARMDGGVEIRDANYETFRRLLRVVLPAPAEIVRTYYDFIKAQLGKPYDQEAILGYIAGRDWRDDRKWFCSELVTAGLEASGYFPFPLSTPSNKMTPEDLLLACSTRVEIPMVA